MSDWALLMLAFGLSASFALLIIVVVIVSLIYSVKLLKSIVNSTKGK